VTIVIVYETHSLSIDNERGIGTGWLDGELSQRGRELARELGGRRRDDGIVAVYTSDLGRAVETAELAFGGYGASIHTDWRLRECNYGELNGQPISRFEGEPPRRIDMPYPGGGESYRQVVEPRTLVSRGSPGRTGRRADRRHRARRHMLGARAPARRDAAGRIGRSAIPVAGGVGVRAASLVTDAVLDRERSSPRTREPRHADLRGVT
jgi:hypothetical protein